MVDFMENIRYNIICIFITPKKLRQVIEMKIKELYLKSAELDGKSVSVCGWVRTLRASKSFGFVELNDGSFFKNIQVVILLTNENYTKI